MNWSLAHAVVTGSDHVRFGIGCHDAAAIVRRPDVLLVAVSDGAGSARHPEIGAQTAVAAALAYLQANPAPDGAGLVASVQAALISEAARLVAPLSALSCTLLVARVDADGAFFGQIGDGAIVTLDSGLDLVFAPHKGEHTNETRFVTAVDAASHLQTRRTAAPVAFAVLTDGLERLALDLTTLIPFRPFFDPLFAALRGLGPDSSGSPALEGALGDAEAELSAELAAFLASPRVADATGDDVTLVLCARR
jgi:hypothetical protein